MNISVVIVGRDRTMMTIECIKNILLHLKGCSYNIIVGSDRSKNGHIQAIRSYLNTITKCDSKVLDCVSLGQMMNDCCNEGFKTSDYVLCIENDMIMHRDMYPEKYINVMSATNIGNIQFRYFAQDTHNSFANIFQYDGKTYACIFPGTDLSKTCPVSFGQNLMSKKFYSAIGGFLGNEFETDKVERAFVQSYVQQLSTSRLVNAIDCDNMHRMMNDDIGIFYHIGISSQHANVTWNKQVIPCQYHYLSDVKLDDAFRNIFINPLS